MYGYDFKNVFREKEMASNTDVRGFRSRHPSGGRIIEETSPSKPKNFTTDKPTQNLEVPKAHYPKGTARSTSMVDEITMTGNNLSASLGALSTKSDTERRPSQTGSIPGSPRKSRKAEDKVRQHFCTHRK